MIQNRNLEKDLKEIHSYIKRKYNYVSYLQEDLLSEANYQFATIIKEYEGPINKFLSYSIFIINSKIIEYLRSKGPYFRNGKKRNNPILFSQYKYNINSLFENSYSTFENFNSFKEEGIKKLYESLDEDEKNIINEIYFNGKTVSSLSKEKGCSYQKIKLMHDKSLEKMRD